jgi:hypothetical protein
MTMALRAARGEAPREFGYFFRAFGYFGNLPFINRRLVNEARLTADQLAEWDEARRRR